MGTDQHELTILSIVGNQLYGTIPESLCTIGPSCSYLYLYDNKLTGA